ncbi:MAG TPA: sugar phosphate isomerase/epimerase, partial [Armatimonadota bacterium]|nr:sugar phosphate isomerase/epimerase [Armatimonadota bacterium]
MSHNRTLTRRELLRNAAVGAAGLAAVPAAAWAQQQRPRPYGPFRMGIQSYSLRGYKLDEALDKTQQLGLHFWEAFAAHVPLTTDAAQITELKNKLQAHRIRLVAHGVSAFGPDEAANRKIFDAAKALGVTTLSADPSPDSFDNLEKLVEEYQINIAIHNHGPGARYDKLQQVVDAVKGRNKRIGACADLGHFLRSGEDPVKVIET